MVNYLNSFLISFPTFPILVSTRFDKCEL